MFYEILLFLHSWLRWLVLIAAVLVIGRSLYGWFGKQTWGQIDRRLGLLYVTSIDIQVTLGIILFFLSPLISIFLNDIGAAMGIRPVRFIAVEHTIGMLLALVVAHVGNVLSKRAATDRGKFVRATLFYTAALILILVSIPWPFLYPDRPWLAPFDRFPFN
jgi:hypothetical protein